MFLAENRNQNLNELISILLLVSKFFSYYIHINFNFLAVNKYSKSLIMQLHDTIFYIWRDNLELGRIIIILFVCGTFTKII